MDDAGLQAGFISEGNRDGLEIRLALQEEYNASSDTGNRIFLKPDGFALMEKAGTIWIVGNGSRAILYGVYRYAEIHFGWSWVFFGEKGRVAKNSEASKGLMEVSEPVFKRRGNIIETIDDPVFVSQLIDWGGKNGLNEMFFTFFIWEQLKGSVRELLRQRDFHVTLGGHSMKYLLGTIDSGSAHPETELHHLLEDSLFQEKLIARIIEICRTDSIISRISLWPEDKGIDSEGFLESYISFMDRLEQAIQLEGLAVKVEHIVYNAGLSWNMLERNPQTEASGNIDVLYAYWGRDYQHSLTHHANGQNRAYSSLKDWREQTRKRKREITVLEYYSDHFMLSELFPPLISRIQEDIEEYRNAGVDGLLNLVVPLHIKELSPAFMANHPWERIQQINNFFYAGQSWGKANPDLIQQFAPSLHDTGKWMDALLGLEKILAEHTKWNIPLFPARIVDPEKIGELKEVSEILLFLDKVIDFIEGLELSNPRNLTDAAKDEAFSDEEVLEVYFLRMKEIAVFVKGEWLKQAGVMKDEYWRGK